MKIIKLILALLTIPLISQAQISGGFFGFSSYLDNGSFGFFSFLPQGAFRRNSDNKSFFFFFPNNSGSFVEKETSVSVPKTQQITQYGITWTFDKEYEYGTFVNGDYWVIGPAIIVSITPDCSNGKNGWEVNPIPGIQQGFDNRVADFSANLTPSLPYIANPGASIVKAVSISGECNYIDPGAGKLIPCLETAAVLTVLSEVPLENGKNLFRPPYSGSEKLFYYTTQLKTSLLPSLASPQNSPTLEKIQDDFQRVKLDLKQGWTGRALHPSKNLPDYGADISLQNSEGALRLMLNDPIDAKMPALINYIQAGLDFYGLMKNGAWWGEGGGQGVGRKLPIAFAAVMLDSYDLKKAAKDASIQGVFQEDLVFKYSLNAGSYLYAETECSEDVYWKKLAQRENSGGANTCKDPYGYIDGGYSPGMPYLYCCIAKNCKASSLAVALMPLLADVWNNQGFLEAINRYINQGIITQPDPCAPAKGIYGEDYGPDGRGGCILDKDASDGIGRFPAQRGYYKDEGYYSSAFADQMWKLYK